MSERVGPILLIDDEPEFLNAFEKQLRKLGYVYFFATGGEEGLDLMRTGPVQLVICDIIMSPMDGFQFCREVRKNRDWDSIPILLLSVRNDPQTRAEGLDSGADGFLSKPFRINEFRATAEALIRFSRRVVESARPPDQRRQERMPDPLAAPVAGTEISPFIDCLGRGKQAFSRGDFEQAIGWLEAALIRDAGDKEARRLLTIAREHFMDWVRMAFPALDCTIINTAPSREATGIPYLDEEEMLVYHLIDNSRSAQEIADSSRLGTYKTYRLLVDLFKRGLIGFHDRRGNPQFYEPKQRAKSQPEN